jgi:hypothetical protein
MQVSHHPPIFAFHTESNCRSYQCYGEIEIKNKFWGRSIEVTLSSKPFREISQARIFFMVNRNDVIELDLTPWIINLSVCLYSISIESAGAM